MKTRRIEKMEDLADLLIARGLVVSSREDLLGVLKIVGYYRLTGFLYPYRANDGTENFRPGTSLAEIWRLYTFDRRLRELAFQAISRIEVALRAMIIRYQGELCTDDPLLYRDHRWFPGHDVQMFSRMLSYICRAVGQASNEASIKHFARDTDLPGVPVWAMMEVISLGTVTLYYEGLPFAVKKRICDEFSIHPNVFSGWLMAIKKVRNICAHHTRLWNHKIVARLSLKMSHNSAAVDLYECLKAQNSMPYTTVFSVLSICAYMLRSIRPQSQWTTRVKSLLADYPEVPLVAMGFPSNWQALALWK